MPRKPPKISDGLRAKFKAVAHEAGELVPSAAYANYVIIDPTFSDRDELLPGVPIYIGQTARIVPRIQEHKPDVVTMDIDMPGPNGLETIERVIQNQQQRSS